MTYLGADEFDFEEEKVSKDTASRVYDKVRHRFSPEFINRIDEMVIFNRLGRESLRKIVDVRISDLEKRISTRNLTLDIDDAAKVFFKLILGLAGGERI